MTNRTASAVVIMCALLVRLTDASRFNDMKITTPKSPYSEGTSALGSAPPTCWCGPNTICWYPPNNNTKHCACAEGYVGTAPSCRPAPELWSLCFADNPCGLHAECEVDNGTRSCHCPPPYGGSPPQCAAPPACRNIERACGANAECNPHFAPPCECTQGFVGEPPNCTAGPALLAQCDPYSCGAYANCRIQDGRPVCTCEPGYEGTPPRCRPGPETWRVCFKDRPCGPHAKCEMVDRVAVCSPCDEGYSGQPPHCYKSFPIFSAELSGMTSR